MPQKKRGRQKRRVSVRVTPAWLDEVREAMRERKWDARKLAQATGLTDASMSRMFSGEAGSKTIFAVAKTLGLYDPHTALQERVMREWYELGLSVRQRDEGKFLQWVAYIRKWLEFEALADDVFTATVRAVNESDAEDDGSGGEDDDDDEHALGLADAVIVTADRSAGIEVRTLFGAALTASPDSDRQPKIRQPKSDT